MAAFAYHFYQKRRWRDVFSSRNERATKNFEQREPKACKRDPLDYLGGLIHRWHGACWRLYTLFWHQKCFFARRSSLSLQLWLFISFKNL